MKLLKRILSFLCIMSIITPSVSLGVTESKAAVSYPIYVCPDCHAESSSSGTYTHNCNVSSHKYGEHVAYYCNKCNQQVPNEMHIAGVTMEDYSAPIGKIYCKNSKTYVDGKDSHYYTDHADMAIVKEVTVCSNCFAPVESVGVPCYSCKPEGGEILGRGVTLLKSVCQTCGSTKYGNSTEDDIKCIHNVTSYCPGGDSNHFSRKCSYKGCEKYTNSSCKHITPHECTNKKPVEVRKTNYVPKVKVTYANFDPSNGADYIDYVVYGEKIPDYTPSQLFYINYHGSPERVINDVKFLGYYNNGVQLVSDKGIGIESSDLRTNTTLTPRYSFPKIKDYLNTSPRYPVSGKYFLGWSLSPNKTTSDYLVSEDYQLSGDLDLYPIYQDLIDFEIRDAEYTYKPNQVRSLVSIIRTTGVTARYGLSKGNYTTSDITSLTKTDAGVYKIYYKLTKTGYKTEEGYATLTINKDAQQVSSYDYTGDYDEQQHSIIVVPHYSDSKVYYGTNADDITSQTVPSYKDVGEYPVYWKVTHDNYATVTGVNTVKINECEKPNVKLPTLTSIEYGQKLSTSRIENGDTSGTFAFVEPDSIVEVGDQTVLVEFTPTNTNYKKSTFEVPIHVDKGYENINYPTVGAIVYGQSIKSSVLTGGSTSGTFRLKRDDDYDYIPTSIDDKSVTIEYTPNDTTHYNSQSRTVNMTINKQVQEITFPTFEDLVYESKFGSAKLIGGSTRLGTFKVAADDTHNDDDILSAGTYEIKVEYTPNETSKYANQTQMVTLNVVKKSIEVTYPVLSNIVYGTNLENITNWGYDLNGYTGTFSVEDTSKILEAGSHKILVTFTPSDTLNYNVLSKELDITVEKATQEIVFPTASSITYEDKLSKAELIGGSTDLGTFTFVEPDKVLEVGTHSVQVKYTPNDTKNYVEQLQNISVTVVKKVQPIEYPKLEGITYGDSLSASRMLGGSTDIGNFYFAEPNKMYNAGTYTVLVKYKPNDTKNYEEQSKELEIKVSKYTESINFPTVDALTYEDTLADAKLVGGDIEKGTFTFESPETVLPAGSNIVKLIYTPKDTDNYNTQERNVTVLVNKKTQDIVYPEVSDITYGQEFSEAVSGGSVELGTFELSNKTKCPSAGTYSMDLEYTPKDISNYNTQRKSVEVVVKKATQSIEYPTFNDIYYGTALNKIPLDGGSTELGEFRFDNEYDVLTAGEHKVILKYTPSDSQNYNTQQKEFTLKVLKYTPKFSGTISAGTITYGADLSNIYINAQCDINGGTYSWDKNAKPNAGEHEIDITYTPLDTDNYNTVSVKAILVVNKASQNSPSNYNISSESLFGFKDGSVTNLPKNTEYRLTNTDEWIGVDGTEITGLASGMYELRLKGDANHDPSSTVNFSIQDGKKYYDYKYYIEDADISTEEPFATQRYIEGDTFTLKTAPQRKYYHFSHFEDEEGNIINWSAPTYNTILYAKYTYYTDDEIYEEDANDFMDKYKDSNFSMDTDIDDIEDYIDNYKNLSDGATANLDDKFVNMFTLASNIFTAKKFLSAESSEHPEEMTPDNIDEWQPVLTSYKELSSDVKSLLNYEYDAYLEESSNVYTYLDFKEALLSINPDNLSSTNLSTAMNVTNSYASIKGKIDKYITDDELDLYNRIVARMIVIDTEERLSGITQNTSWDEIRKIIDMPDTVYNALSEEKKQAVDTYRNVIVGRDFEASNPVTYEITDNNLADLKKAIGGYKALTEEQKLGVSDNYQNIMKDLSYAIQAYEYVRDTTPNVDMLQGYKELPEQVLAFIPTAFKETVENVELNKLASDFVENNDLSSFETIEVYNSLPENVKKKLKADTIEKITTLMSAKEAYDTISNFDGSDEDLIKLYSSLSDDIKSLLPDTIKEAVSKAQDTIDAKKPTKNEPKDNTPVQKVQPEKPQHTILTSSYSVTLKKGSKFNTGFGGKVTISGKAVKVSGKTISAKKVGNSKVTITSVSNNITRKVIIDVKVTKKGKKSSGVILLKKGKTFTIKGSNGSIVSAKSTKKIKVTSGGTCKIKALKKGTITLPVSVSNGKAVYKYSIKIKVN